MMYLVLYTGDNADGVNQYYGTKEGVQRLLAEWGEGSHQMDIVIKPPDLESWPSYTAFIMKGEYVVPREVQKVVEWELP